MTLEVTDKYGKRVTRPDGILQDGDMTRVPMRMMDAVDPGLVAAAALADAVKRVEQFDARGHRPGYVTPGAQDAYASSDTARDERDTLVRDAWKNPPSLDDAAKNIVKDARLDPQTSAVGDLNAARDRAASDREQRTRDAWKAA